MSVYQVIVEETVTGTITIDAEDGEAAIELARQRYESGEYVLSAGELTSVQFGLVSAAGECELWVEG